MSQQLDALLAVGGGDHKTQVAQLNGLVDELVKLGAEEDIKRLVQKLGADEVPQQVSRPGLLYLSNALVAALSRDEVFANLAILVIQSLRQHDEADYVLRMGLFHYYVKEDDNRSAGMILAGLNFSENSNKSLSVDDKADIYLKIAEAFLMDDESSAEQAETFAQKASALMSDVSNNSVAGQIIHLRYKSTHARVLDANRKFVDAAMRYYELSITSQETIDLLNLKAGELLTYLGMAVTCVVLGKAGPQRSRVLGVLFKDDRLHQLDYQDGFTSHASILTKMYTEQLLRRDELATFEESLAEHQKAITADGFSFPEKAVIEHNMLAAGKLYDNIHFSELGSLLRLDAVKAERVAARMITEDRLKATIDQTEALLVYLNDDDALHSWDQRIQDVCNEIGEVCDLISS